MVSIIKKCKEMVGVLNDTKGTNAKIDILKSYSSISPLIKRVWDPNTKTGITDKGWDKYVKNKSHRATETLEKYDKYSKYRSGDMKLYDLFDDITSRQVTGDAAKAAIYVFMNKYDEEYHVTIRNIFAKNLRIRMGATNIKKAFPAIFDIYKVILAKDYTKKTFDKSKQDTEKYLKKIKGDSKHDTPFAYISKKEDGIRLALHVDFKNKKAMSKSRGNKVFTTLKVLEKAITELDPLDDLGSNIVFDGEVMVDSKDSKDNRNTRGDTFNDITSQIRKKDVQMKNPIFCIFDVLTKDEFDGTAVSAPYGERYKIMKKIIPANHPNLKIMTHYPYTDQKFEELKSKADESDWEGLMIRFNYKYERKRTKKLLKYKLFQREEYKVKDVVVTEMPFPNDKGGEDVHTALHSIIIEHKKNNVSVGSGFDKDQRIQYGNNPELIKGKLVHIKYQDESKNNKTKKYSLRLPIFEGLVSTDSSGQRNM